MGIPVIARIAASILLSVAIAAAAQSAPAPGSAPSTQPRAPRVRVKLEGFDMTPQAAPGKQGGAPATRRTSANQIGGASRGIGEVKLFAPDTGLAYSLHPTFDWSGSPDTQYKLQIEDVAAHTTFEVTVDGTSFTYPQAATPLKPGSTYTWKVQPVVELMGSASDTATIVIAGGAKRAEIEAALAAITQTGPAGDRFRAQVYFDKRAWYDAAAAYSILISAHPGDRELHRMRGTLYDQVPATEKLADEDFAMAN